MHMYMSAVRTADTVRGVAGRRRESHRARCEHDARTDDHERRRARRGLDQSGPHTAQVRTHTTQQLRDVIASNKGACIIYRL